MNYSQKNKTRKINHLHHLTHTLSASTWPFDTGNNLNTLENQRKKYLHGSVHWSSTVDKSPGTLVHPVKLDGLIYYHLLYSCLCQSTTLIENTHTHRGKVKFIWLIFSNIHTRKRGNLEQRTFMLDLRGYMPEKSTFLKNWHPVRGPMSFAAKGKNRHNPLNLISKLWTPLFRNTNVTA